MSGGCKISSVGTVIADGSRFASTRGLDAEKERLRVGVKRPWRPRPRRRGFRKDRVQRLGTGVDYCD
ncbi:hypothetical protein ACLB2K_046700 [Fragaria x ananassa]